MRNHGRINRDVNLINNLKNISQDPWIGNGYVQMNDSWVNQFSNRVGRSSVNGHHRIVRRCQVFNENTVLDNSVFVFGSLERWVDTNDFQSIDTKPVDHGTIRRVVLPEVNCVDLEITNLFKVLWSTLYNLLMNVTNHINVKDSEDHCDGNLVILNSRDFSICIWFPDLVFLVRNVVKINMDVVVKRRNVSVWVYQNCTKPLWNLSVWLSIARNGIVNVVK